MKLLYLVFYCFISCWANASGMYDNLTEQISSFVTQTDCQKNSILNAANFKDQQLSYCKRSNYSESLLDFKKISDGILIRQFAEKEKVALQCFSERWLDLSSRSENDPVMKDIVSRINAELPELDQLQIAIHKVSMENQNPGLKFKNDKSLSAEEKSKKIVQVQKEVNDELEKLQMAYNFHLARIPYSNLPLVKKYIESMLSGISGKLQPSTNIEFKKVTVEVKDQSLLDKKEVDEGLANSNFSSTLESKMLFDLEHVQSLIKDSPDTAPSIFALQCRIKQRENGDMIVSATGTVVTSVMTGSAMLLARASRLAVLAADGRTAINSAGWARSLTYAATGLSTVQSIQYVVAKCSRDLTATKVSCKADLEVFKTDSQMVRCIESGALAFGFQAATGLPKLLNKNSQWAKYLERRAALRSSVKMNPEFAIKDFGSLTDSITILAKVNGEATRIEARILERGVGTNGKPYYKVLSKNPTTGSPISAKLSEESFMGLKPKNQIVVKAPSDIDGIEVRELNDELTWKDYFADEANNFSEKGFNFERPALDSNLKIIKSAETTVEAAPKSSEVVFVAALGTNKTKAKVINGMQIQEITTIEILGPAEKIDGNYKFPIKIQDSTRREPQLKYLTEAEILRLVPVTFRKP